MNEVKFRGGTGAGPPPVFLRFGASHPGHRSMNVWKGIFFRENGVEQWKESPALTSGRTSGGTMFFRIVFICMYNLFV